MVDCREKRRKKRRGKKVESCLTIILRPANSLRNLWCEIPFGAIDLGR
jgi:hypothetical protein